MNFHNNDQILLVLAAISFGLGAFSVPAGRINWQNLGLMFVTLAFLL